MSGSGRNTRTICLALILFPCVFAAGCGTEPRSDAVPAGNKGATTPLPVTERPSIESTATSPPASLIETLRVEMLAAAPAPARESHPASKLVGEGCDEMSFSYYDKKGDETEYIGLYRCPMKGAILGISKYDSQVYVIGQITNKNSEFSRGIVEAKASN